MALLKMKDLLTKAFGDSTGPLGFPMRSEDATELETVLKNRPAELKDMGLMHMTCLSKATATTFEEGEHADVSMVTTSMLDRDREVVLAGGIDWKQFKKSPVVTFAHMYDCLPVGKCLWLKSEKTKAGEDGWLAKTRYSPRPTADLWPAQEPWFPDAVFSLVQSGDLQGKSIGFIPLSARAPTDKELKNNPALANCRVIFDKTLALEYAVAPVQANPDSLVVSVSKCRKKGMRMPDQLLSALGMVMMDESDDEDLALVKKNLKNQGITETELAIKHVTLSSLQDSVLSRVDKALSSLDIGTIVGSVMAKKQGRV